MTYITIDDKDEVQKILLDQISYYKEELKKGSRGLTYAHIVDKVVQCVKSAEDDGSEENEDYDESIAYSDIKWFLKTEGLLED